MAVFSVFGEVGDGEETGRGESISSVEHVVLGRSVVAEFGVLMPVRVVEIGDDVASRLVDVPIQPCRGGNHAALGPSTVVGELVDVVDMDIAWLRAHGLELAVIFDGQQASGVPEAFVVRVKGGHGGGG